MATPPASPTKSQAKRKAVGAQALGSAGKSPLQKALEKLGLRRDIDLALHLPLRYEDETRITRLRDARDGEVVQIEATVTSCEISYRPRRQLVVTVNDGSDTCLLRFFSFYPSQQKALAVGNVLRCRGEVKGGFLGLAMVHPSYKNAGGDLPVALTPVYSTVAGLAQPYLRKVVASGLQRADLSETTATPPGRGSSWKSFWPRSCRNCKAAGCATCSVRRSFEAKKRRACTAACWPHCPLN